MLAILYILLSVFIGYIICRNFIPQLANSAGKDFEGYAAPVSGLFVELPAWYIIGTVVLTWIVYILACVFAGTDSPVMIALAITAALCLIHSFFGMRRLIRLGRQKPGFSRLTVGEIIVFAVLALFASFLMFRSLFINGDSIYVGLSVFSDFTPHLSMIRSFSYGNNFPTAYSVCAGSDIRYHFMFEFLAGLLEYLGLRLDLAFNIPSILGLLSMFSLLYAITVKVSGHRAAGMTVLLLQTFRSSASFFLFLADRPASVSLLDHLKYNTEFIGYTANESWGLWNLNVYCNQRHFAFGLCILLLMVYIFLPHVYEGYRHTARHKNIASRAVHCFFDPSGWTLSGIAEPIACGVILGSLAFWNGAVLIATLCVLFFMAVISSHRLNYLITAAITLGLSLLQSYVFVDESVVSPSYRYGFLADNPTVSGSMLYLLKLLGILPLLLLFLFLFVDGLQRYLMFAFSTPLIMAFTLSLTIDVTVNHKYVMISVMLLNIYAAEFISMLIVRGDLRKRIIAFLLLICMTSTGIYDLYVLSKKNKPENDIVLDRNSEITAWVKDNCSAKDLFCTSNYYISGGDGSHLIMGGAMLYNAWQYFGWSAGYDTDFRDKVTAAVYGASSSDRLRYYVDKIGFDYIVVDICNRESQDYQLREDIIADTYPAVFTTGEGDYRFTVYCCSDEAMKRLSMGR